MTPVEPEVVPEGGRLVVFAKDQPPYLPLPTVIDANGAVVSEWALTKEETERLLVGGRIRLCVHTFDPEIGTPGHALQPVSICVLAPECGVRES